MKKLIILSMVALINCYVFAQSPQKMSYQCVVRNSSGVLLSNQSIRIRISILQGNSSGPVVYTETQTPTTNANGLVSIEIGGGTGFDAINWANESYFLKTETDPAGGTNYTITGTSQLLSVPYALYSKTSQTADYNNLTNKPDLSGYLTTESDPVFTSSPSNGITSGNINNWNTAFGWGNHAGLYRSISWVPAWTDVTSKPNFATVATSGSYNDLINLPVISVSTDATLAGNGTAASPLKIAQQAAATGQALKWNGTNWAPGNDLLGSSLWLANGSNIYYNTGGVGIGTNIPYAFLNIYGNTNMLFPHLLLTESEADYARLSFKNTATSTKIWTIAGKPDAIDANSILNFYYDNGSTGTNILSVTGTGNMTVTGNVGIGLTNPTALLHTRGISTGGGNVVFVGEYKFSNPGNPPVSGYGTRMMWYPDKAAFRVGRVEGSQWDAIYIGNNSTGMGRNTLASGNDAIAMGPYSIASGECSTAMGFMSTAASSYCTALGTANIGGGNAITWVGTDPIFEIGNGWGTPLQRHNAMTVLKNGYVGFGTATPSAGLHIKADTWPGSFIYLEANSGSDAGVRFYEGTTPKWHIYSNAAAGGLQITNSAAGTAIFAKQSNAFVGIGTTNPAYTLDVAGAVNLIKGLSGAALLCNGSQAIWYDGTCYSWGYQGTYNYFANKVTIGNAANPSYMLYVQGSAFATGTWSPSDIRIKKNVFPVDNALSGILKIRGVSFEFREDEFKDYQFDEGPQFGFIAQELEGVFPEVVKTESNGFKSVNYNAMIPVLLEAIKEQQKSIDQMKAENDDLKARLEKIEAIVGNLKD